MQHQMRRGPVDWVGEKLQAVRNGGGKRSEAARAVVTGAASGIGRAFALELARRGGEIVCADVDLKGAEATVREVIALGGRGLASVCDVSNEGDVRRVAEEAESFFSGPLTLIVNNAGIGVGGETAESTPMEDWRRTLGVNLWGVIHGCHVFVPMLRAENGGGVINVASAAGFAAAPRMGAYNVSKAGVVALSETLAAELAGTDIAVTVLCPTFVATNIVNNGRIAEQSAKIAQRLMALSGVAAEDVARETLDAHDIGQLYVVPQWDARLIWRMKRAAPSAYARSLGLVERAMGALGRKSR